MHHAPLLLLITLVILFGTSACGRTSGLAQQDMKPVLAEAVSATAPGQQAVLRTPAPTALPREPQPKEPSPVMDTQPQPTTNPNPSPPKPEELVQNFATIHHTFTLVDEADTSKAHMTRDQVLKIVNQEYADTNPSAITCTLGMLTDNDAVQGAQVGRKVDTTFLTPRLVWVVSLSGFVTRSAGPPGSRIQTTNEFDVVFDAQSGAELFSFAWTR